MFRAIVVVYGITVVSAASQYSVSVIPANGNLYGINNSGQAAGTSAGSTGLFIAGISGPTSISLPSGLTNGTIYSINKSGNVGGWGQVGTSGVFQAFVGSTSGSWLIPLPSGMSIYDGAIGINDSNEVAGAFAPNESSFAAFTGSMTQSTVISLPSHWTSMSAVAITTWDLRREPRPPIFPAKVWSAKALSAMRPVSA
jgi:hypothetical protein